MRVDFYHLEKKSIDEALPQILKKAILKQKVLIKTEMAERADYFNTLLWTFEDDSFLPHGVEKDGHASSQPVFITHKENFNPNQASLLIIVDNEPVPQDCDFERVLYFFNGRDENALVHARSEFKRLKDLGIMLSYWKQDESGRWDKKE